MGIGATCGTGSASGRASGGSAQEIAEEVEHAQAVAAGVVVLREHLGPVAHFA